MQKRTFRENLEQLLPAYARMPLLFLVIINLLAYYGSRLIPLQMAPLNMQLPLDGRIPFRQEWIIIYILAYLQWVVGYVLIARESREHCRRVLTGEMIAKLICMVLFVVLPTRIERPQVEGRGLCAFLVRLIYATDAPINLFPSIHCLESWICFRGAVGMKRVPRWYAPAMLVLTLLVFASTVLVKQHVLVDIPAGILVGEVGLLLANRLFAIRQRRKGGCE